MRKLLLISFLSIVAIAESNAQSKFRPGIKAGLSLSKFTDVPDTSYKSDFYVGGEFGIKLTKFYTLQPEVVYSRQGAIVNDYKFSMDYLSLVVYNKFNFQGFFVGVGPSVDFLLNDNFGQNGDNDAPIGLDLSLHAGIGYTFPIGLTVEARIKQGMVDIFGNDYYDDYYDDYDYRNILNQSFQIGVSYTFDINKK
ncbi:porin family protein [Flavobacterium sp. 3HN19-14]|uniref:porin family protein n=1 Tax=Flavobacterium sp. 3HN19-14 TaxID=3448133 RepID=UPI003EE30D47